MDFLIRTKGYDHELCPVPITLHTISDLYLTTTKVIVDRLIKTVGNNNKMVIVWNWVQKDSLVPSQE